MKQEHHFYEKKFSLKLFDAVLKISDNSLKLQCLRCQRSTTATYRWFKRQLHETQNRSIAPMMMRLCQKALVAKNGNSQSGVNLMPTWSRRRTANRGWGIQWICFLLPFPARTLNGAPALSEKHEDSSMPAFSHCCFSSPLPAVRIPVQRSSDTAPNSPELLIRKLSTVLNVSI